METGKVKWFNRTKGYGFIEPGDNGKDVFVHLSELEKQGIYDLKEDQQVSFKREENRGKVFAADIKLED